MNNNVFSSMYDKLMGKFDSPPRPAAKAAVWDVCQGYPDVLADFVLLRADDLDKKPGNVSRFVKMCWFEWRDKNPSACAKAQTFGCSFCDNGTIWCVREHERLGWVPETATCGHCRPQGITIEQIEASGGRHVHAHEALSLCAQLNSREKSPSGSDFNSQLKSWESGRHAYERTKVPDDDHPDVAEGWF